MCGPCGCAGSLGALSAGSSGHEKWRGHLRNATAAGPVFARACKDLLRARVACKNAGSVARPAAGKASARVRGAMANQTTKRELQSQNLHQTVDNHALPVSTGTL